jgi:hypothetical protein
VKIVPCTTKTTQNDIKLDENTGRHNENNKKSYRNQ